jgi:predicted nucleic acid-binding protein
VTTLVLDASVALKWAMPLAREPLMEESLRLLKRYTDGEFDLAVPDVFWAELGNILWRGARWGRWTRNDADVTSADFRARDFVTVSSHVLLPEALKIAFAYDRAVSDCLYVALAVQAGTELITADERLANALAAYLPVKWLGSF